MLFNIKIAILSNFNIESPKLKKFKKLVFIIYSNLYSKRVIIEKLIISETEILTLAEIIKYRNFWLVIGNLISKPKLWF